MTTLARTDTSVVGRWWWTVDRWILLALALLFGLGALLTLAASPAAAERIELEPFHFARRHFLYLGPAVATLLAISLLSPSGVRRLALAGLGASLLLLLATLLLGPEIKGARRWLVLGGLSLQPSEFVKPFLVVAVAWLFALERRNEEVPGRLLGTALMVLVVALLVAQPDLGMTAVVFAVFCTQLFLAGLPGAWVLALLACGGIGAAMAYLFIPHVSSRVDRFLDPSIGDSYQVETALEAFGNGGVLGRGPGEGVVKRLLPDAHTDFIFAVAGEEYGLLVCLFIVAVFAFVTLRGFARLLGDDSVFVLLAAGGLLTQFGLQAAINMGVNLRLLPTKGMTLPFISYGGSSLLALAVGMGMVLALTRRRPHGSAEA